MNQRSAISKINKSGILLVFPINNQKEPASLWREFFPRKKMRWEWDEGGDNSVGEMWSLMKRLSDHREVVYSKWYQGRATFFSKELFVAMLALVQKDCDPQTGLSPTASLLLETLESDSPLSTKELKKATELQGKFNEPNYTRGMKELFSRFLVIAHGEVDDGAFPSLAVGATRTLYEEHWNQALGLDRRSAEQIVELYIPTGNLFRRAFDRVRSDLQTKGGNPAFEVNSQGKMPKRL